MNQNSANHSIKCTVTSCAYHSADKEYCTLNEIKVGCCDDNVSQCQQTECASFALGNHGTSCSGR